MTLRVAALHMLVAALFFGSNGVLAKYIAWNPIGTAWSRGFFATIVLILGVTLLKMGAFRIKYWRRLLLAGTLLVISNVSWIVAAMDPGTTIGKLTTLVFIYPFFLIFLDWRFRGRIPLWYEMLLLCSCVSGLAVLYGDQLDFSFSYGDYLTLLSAVLFAVQVFVIQGLREFEELQSNVELQTRLSVGSALIGQIIGVFLTPLLLLVGPELVAPTQHEFVLLAILGVVTGLSYLLMSRAVLHLSGQVPGRNPGA